MDNLANNAARNVAIFINDFDQEFADGLEKLAVRLGRPLRGVILLDPEVKKKKLNKPDKSRVFEQIICDFSDEAALHDIGRRFEKNLLLVTCGDDRNVAHLQRLLPHIPYVLGPTERSLDWSTHKSLMREMLTSYDSSLVPKVQTVTSADDDEIEKILKRLEFPLIIKPTGLAGSVLVSKVHDETELRQGLEQSFEVINKIYDRDIGRGKPSMIAEEFIVGHMYSLDAYVNEMGQVWMLPLLDIKSAHDVGLEGFLSYQIDSKLHLTDDEIAAGYEAAEKSIYALGLRSSVAHIEMYHTDDGWKIIELGPRPGGRRQDIYQISYGVDHAYNELLIKVGLPPEIASDHRMYTSALMFPAEAQGTVMAIDGLEEASKLPAVHSFIVQVHPGEVALLSKNGGNSVLKALLYGPDHKQLAKDVERVRSMIKVIIDRSSTEVVV